MPPTTSPTVDELAIADDPTSWSNLGFTVAHGACQLGGVRIGFVTNGQRRGIVGWSLRAIVTTDLDGLPTTRSERPVLTPPSASTHPNGVYAIDHIVAVSPNLQRSVAALQSAGLDLRRIREEPTPAGAPRQAFFRLGAEILELVQAPEEAIERTGGPDVPARFWGLALLVEDLDRAVARLGEHASEPRAAVQPGRRIATLRRSAGLSLPLALMSAEESVGVGR